MMTTAFRFMTAKGIAATLLIVMIICNVTVAQRKSRAHHVSEQTHFSAEDLSVQRPTSIPDSVLAILKKDEGVRDVLESEGMSGEKVPLSWFSASAVHLSRSERAGLVVMAEGPLRGPNGTIFWVFCSGSRGYELVLTAPEHDLFVKKTTSQGYRDIELVALTASRVSSVLCRFDGKRYAEYRSKSEPIR